MRLGIDFGTSFSLPATSYMGDETILLPSGTYGIPSVFYYDEEDDNVLIGQEAEDAGQGDQARNLKREIKMELTKNPERRFKYALLMFFEKFLGFQEIKQNLQNIHRTALLLAAGRFFYMLLLI